MTCLNEHYSGYELIFLEININRVERFIHDFEFSDFKLNFFMHE